VDSERARWLGERVEPALEPDLLIVDSHHHLWSHPGDEYGLEDLRADTGAGHHVVQTVFVECGERIRDEGPAELRSLEETRWVAGLADQSDRTPGAVIAGIVGYVDLRLGPDAVRRGLEAHREAAGGRLVGVRHATAWHTSPAIFDHRTHPTEALLLDERFRASVAVLADLGLTFDSFIYHPQVPELTELAGRFPDVQVILDHVGSPVGVGPYAGRRHEVLVELEGYLAALAAQPNAHLKLGGIGMPWFGNAWHKDEVPPSSEDVAAAWGPFFRRCIDLFGPDRCMFESNFPVDRRSMSYVVAWNAYKRLTADLSPGERGQLFSGTARRVYGLPIP
jgi:predicted TIM-barrel fold metal-dependent hydrolase